MPVHCEWFGEAWEVQHPDESFIVFWTPIIPRFLFLATSFRVDSAIKGSITVARFGINFFTMWTIPSTDRNTRTFAGVSKSTMTFLADMDVVCRQDAPKILHVLCAKLFFERYEG